ncbi:NAD-dependent epimerase/dehydratase family protein [Dyadobacter aurulentus]|uniref:NAD-dependent epimerase/dehydratase family protein n=1 Tax=Dyadobacter sp. UC 10 TaxID=2605428 RepID=UPI0011F3A7D8|nr:NAD-dependent epimerase/dehydratase family protein [Dyadobacter sp. UC 10]KAA0993179.1 NAD-dependent epimerase/dehydratase family protein [Dyadobacter sp. UC 10]
MTTSTDRKINAIVTGATGMVGEGVLHQCLQSPDVESVLMINRKPAGITHPKLTEIIHRDFQDLSPIADQLNGYNACYFCLGVSSVGMKEPEYTKMTYILTMHVAEVLSSQNPDMTFCYVSGAGTDSSEKGRSMWARVKGKTENDLMKLPFRQVFAFRPGIMTTSPELKNTLPLYKYISWLFPFIRRFFPNSISSLAQVGQAMINATQNGFDKKILEVKDINALGDRQYV